MNLGLILKRSRREWRQLAVLCFALTLVTAFFALGPLYARASVQSGLQYELDAVRNAGLKLTFTNPNAWTPEAYDTINSELGSLNAGLARVARSSVPVGGFSWEYGEQTTIFTPRAAGSYFYAFSDLPRLVRVVEGRLPQRLPPKEAPERRGGSAEEQRDRGVGIYSTGDVEAVVSATVVAQSRIYGLGFEVGTRFVVGNLPENIVVVNIVGIIEPVDENDPAWTGQRIALSGELSDAGMFDSNYTPSVLVTEGAYTDWISEATRTQYGLNNSYQWSINLDTSRINADNITDIRERLARLTAGLTNTNEGLNTANPLGRLLDRYLGRVAQIESPILLLSGAVLVMMLYHLVTTVNLVLEQQAGEWAGLSSRGANTWQLFTLQGIAMTLLGVIAAVIGPFLALGILYGLNQVGPLATATSGRLPIGGIPERSFQLSILAAIIGVAMLTLPAIPAAARSLAQFKQTAARPPSRPVWARYYLDVICILIGLGLIARLLFYVEADFSQTLARLGRNPSALIQLILDSANRTGGLSDPLNLVGPAVLLTGIALLWLRIFPSIMRGFGAITKRLNSLVAPLAVWNVERDPGHYAQLVLLLIGTLALGTAALALGTTRDTGAWSAARGQIGGAVQVMVADPVPDLAGLPDVSGTASILRLTADQRSGMIPIQLIGVDPDQMSTAFPDLNNTLSPIKGSGLDLVQGIGLPDGATGLEVTLKAQIRSSNVQITALYPRIQIADPTGKRTTIMLTADSFTAGEWITYRGELPAVSGYKITALDVSPYVQGSTRTTLTLFVDRLQAINADGSVTELQSFDAEPPSGTTSDYSNAGLSTDSPAAGSGNWRIDSGTGRVNTDPNADDPEYEQKRAEVFLPVTVAFGAVRVSEIPIIISERLAENLGSLTRDRLPLQVGATGTLPLPLNRGEPKLPYKVVGITRFFPSYTDDQQFIIIDRVTLSQLLNRELPPENSVPAVNQLWLETPTREPSQVLRDALNNSLGNTSGLSDPVYSWDRYNELLREPLPAALAGMLYAGFAVSLLLSLLDFAFYLIVTAKRRSISFAVLQALGWNINRIWLLLVAEQAALVVPALIVGTLLGVALGYIMLPFLALVGGETLTVSVGALTNISGVLIAGFAVLILLTALWLRRLNVNRVLRMGEE